MTGPFDSFVIFAEMRTGSNFLEANLNAIGGIQCFGEAFNPYFIGYPNKQSLLGVTQADRDENPKALLDKIHSSDGVTGFRYFHDHDPRVMPHLIEDRRRAKIILTRNPVESFVSWKIAQSTGQWKLTDVSRRRSAQTQFDPVEFAHYLAVLQGFQADLRKRLHHSGQVAFELRYEDLKSLDVINGLASYLGVEGRLDKLDQNLKVQNPAPLADKVLNREALKGVLNSAASLDPQTPAVLEPMRAAAVTTYITAAQAPLVYLPVRAGPDAVVLPWLAGLDNVSADALKTGLTQKELRHWKRGHKGHRSFTVVRHPVVRAHHGYCRFILGQGQQAFTAIRHKLSRQTKGVIPFDEPGDGYDRSAHYQGFMAFLEFLSANLNGQTAIRVDPAWAHQAQIVSGFAGFAPPDVILREHELQTGLPLLASQVGYAPRLPDSAQPDMPVPLTEIYNKQIERAVRKIYQRDYMMFGFGDWA